MVYRQRCDKQVNILVQIFIGQLNTKDVCHYTKTRNTLIVTRIYESFFLYLEVFLLCFKDFFVYLKKNTICLIHCKLHSFNYQPFVTKVRLQTVRHT